MKKSTRSSVEWSVIRCEPGNEAALMNELLDRLTLHRLESRIEEFFIPSERTTVIRGGRKSSREKTLGLLLVKGQLDEQTSRCMSETPGVLKLLREEEGDRLLKEFSDEKPRVRIEWAPSRKRSR